ncbi:MAG TPA: hypothetical protein VGO13_12150 [Solirubrobacterales bacterium]|nr:hypothetical protein [Solirubrobacterales bacterium]
MSSNRKRALWVGALALFLVAALAVAALLWLPPKFVPDGILSVSDRARLNGEGAVRSTILQLVAGLVVLVGLLYTSLQVGITRETHYTDRYTKAIDQLGHEKAIVRVGGIFALERLALNSSDDGPTVINVLSGYLRTTAPRPLQPPVAPVRTAKLQLSPDIQTALDVLIALENRFTPVSDAH